MPDYLLFLMLLLLLKSTTTTSTTATATASTTDPALCNGVADPAQCQADYVGQCDDIILRDSIEKYCPVMCGTCTTSTTSTTETLTTVTTTTVYDPDNKDCKEREDPCTLKCQSKDERHYKVIQLALKNGRVCVGPTDCKPGDGRCPESSITTTMATSIAPPWNAPSTARPSSSTPQKTSTAEIAAIAASAGILCVIIAIMLYRRRGGNSHRPFTNEVYNKMYMHSESSEYFDPRMTLDPKAVVLGKVIGEGNFGKVYVGTANNPQKGGVEVPVAVKSPSLDARLEFEAEMEIMGQLTRLGGHVNIVSVVGCVYGEEPLLVLELCTGGSLKAALTTARKRGGSSLPPVTTLTTYGHEIALAMKFLEDNRLLHRDLAARNVLLTEVNVCKLSDFGLSRNAGTTNYYRRNAGTSAPIPVRWMAPETLDDNVSTIMSDSWSYGVLLWEIYSLGLRPYTGLNNHEIAGHVRDGHRLEQPKWCPANVYTLMQQCWSLDPRRRPAFADLAFALYRNGVGADVDGEYDSVLPQDENHVAVLLGACGTDGSIV